MSRISRTPWNLLFDGTLEESPSSFGFGAKIKRCQANIACCFVAFSLSLLLLLLQPRER